MNNFFIVFTIFFIIINASNYNNIIITKIHEEYWINTKNTKYTFYNDRTFGIDIYDDPCTKISTDPQFRKYMNNKIKCIGK